MLIVSRVIRVDGTASEQWLLAGKEGTVLLTFLPFYLLPPPSTTNNHLTCSGMQTGEHELELARSVSGLTVPFCVSISQAPVNSRTSS
jgi:hypothetical protein